jgi:Putative peptidoglycan binding domain
MIGLSLLAVSQPTWAAGHGGGGGGGGFGGGGFHGGGFGGGGHFGGGGGFRGGFGGAPHFSGGPARFGDRGVPFAGGARMSPISPHISSRPSRITSSRPALSNVARNRDAIPSSARASRAGRVTNSRPALSNVGRNRGARPLSARLSQTSTQRGLNGRTDHIAERHDANWHRDWDRRHAHFDHDRFFVFEDGFWFGLDPGFYPWDYLPYYAYDYYPYDYYADVQPNDYSEPVYNGAPVADPTVQAVQTELTQLGYYNGPVDGIFGPTTRDALAKYQIATHLNVTGSLSPDTLQSLGLPQVRPS